MKSSNFYFYWILLILAAPIYQSIDELYRNIPGDYKRTFGEHTLFSPLLGAKEKHYNNYNQGWDHDSTILHPPKWMRVVTGTEGKVIVPYGRLIQRSSNLASPLQVTAIVLLRWLIKLIVIPAIFYFILLLFYKSKPS